MTVALALLAGAVLAGWLVPCWLRRVDLSRRDPSVLIVTWLLSMAGVAAASVSAVVLLLLPSHGNVFAFAVHHCWHAVRHGSPPEVEAVSGILTGSALLALGVRLTVIAIRGARRRAHRRAKHLLVLRLAARPGHGGTLWLDHDQPLAFSLSGGVVVATEGLHRHLPADSVAAVLTHERAHVRGRHHAVIALADALSAAVPFVPLFRHAPTAVRELVELAADDAAVRAHGVAAVRSALARVSAHAPGAALAMGRDGMEVRLARLAQLAVDAEPGKPVRRALTCAVAGTTAAMSPAFAAAVVLVAVGLLSCSLT